MISVTVSVLVSCFLKVLTALPVDLPLPPFITLEEHFTTTTLATQVAASLRSTLEDLDGLRLQEMDQGRIAKQ